MTEQMTLLVNSHTQSVLAAATLRGQSGSDLEAADLVGEGLEIRNPADGQVLLEVEPDELEVKTADLLGDVLLQPRAYALVDDQPALQISTPGIIKTGTGVRVTYSALPAGEKAKVWVQLEGGFQDERFVLTAEGTSGGTSVDINHTLPAGTFEALVLVTKHKATVAQI